MAQKEMETKKVKRKEAQNRITTLDNRAHKSLQRTQIARIFSRWRQIIHVKKQ